jgi:hypothetical protein
MCSACWGHIAVQVTHQGRQTAQAAKPSSRPWTGAIGLPGGLPPAASCAALLSHGLTEESRYGVWNSSRFHLN